MIDLQQPEIAFALEVVRQASSLTQRVQTGMALQGLTKSDMSPVTVADFAVQALVGHALQERFPEVVLVGEEKADMLRTEEGATVLKLVTQFVAKFVPEATDEAVCDWIDRGAKEPGKRFWTLDPVDGTKGYLRGGQFAVALALIEEGEVKIGVLGCPNLSETCQPDVCGTGAMQVAQRGEGAYFCAMDEPDNFQPLQVSPQSDAHQARILRSVESGHTNVNEIDLIAQALEIEAEAVLMDSQAKYAVLASGTGEMLFRLLNAKQLDYKERIWDQAAGSIILEEAGGKISDLYGKALDFGQGRTLANNTGIFASNGPLHEAGLKAIAEVCKLP